MFQSCKDCIFAEYDGKTQTGCEFNRIEQMKEIGVNIIEGYDEDKEFFVMENYVCNASRNKEWETKQDFKIKDQRELVIQEIAPKYQFILIDNGDIDFFSLQNSIESCLNQYCRPKAIHIIRHHNSKISLLEMGNLLSKTKLLWSIQDIIKDDDSILEYHINLLLNKYFYLHYIIQDLIHPIDIKASLKLNKEMNVDLTSFAILRYEHYDIVNANIFKILGIGIFNKELIPTLIEEKPNLIIQR